MSSEINRNDAVPPPGFELLFASATATLSESPPLTGFTAILLPIHWAVIRAAEDGIRLVADPERNVLTELLPKDWTKGVKGGVGEENRSIDLVYRDVKSGKDVHVKVIEVLRDTCVSLLCPFSGEKQAGEVEKTSVSLIKIQDYVCLEAVNAGETRLDKVYAVGKLKLLDDTVSGFILAAVENARKREPVKAAPQYKSPYSSNLTPEQEARFEAEAEAKRKREEAELLSGMGGVPGGVPMRPHPFGDEGGVGFPQIGRSDLDPFGGLGSGMLMDPRGFRRPNLGVVPGARFDPVGPVGGPFFGGPRGGFGQRGGGGGAPRLPFAYPNPDHERAPDGFDDMFT